MNVCGRYVTRVISHNGETIAVPSICGCEIVAAYKTLDGPEFRCKDHLEPEWESKRMSMEEALVDEIIREMR